jgi:integrase
MGRLAVKARPANVSFYRDRHGVTRWRFRKKGHPESQTKEPFGSATWWSWYEKARATGLPPVGSSRTKPGSIDDLAVQYYASSDWALLKATTKRTYKGIFDRFRDLPVGEERIGGLPVAKVEPQHLRKVMDRMADRSAAANNLLKVLRVVFAFAVARGLRETNPAAPLKFMKRRSEGFHTWSEEDIQKFERHWTLGTTERLAFDLLLYTAQRSGDVRRLGPQHLRNGFFRVVQEKTGKVLDLPIHPNLKASIKAVGAEHLTYLVTKHGEPYTAKGFSNWISECANQAGLPKVAAAHGLRKAAARRLAEAGCSAHMIMSITGHTSLKEVERYTQAAAQKDLATSAMKRIKST